jgi:hypothetical protein
MEFAGFGPTVFAWFAGLESDNTKAYFTATRDRYEAEVRGGLEALLDELAETFGGTPRVFRQQRDLRFTPDKTPYKTRTYGVLQGAPESFYAELSARGLYAGSGYHGLSSDQLERFRAAVADEATGPALAEAAAAVEGAGLELAGASPAHRPARLPARPPAHRAAAAQGAVRRAPDRARCARHRTRRGARARGRHLARGGAAERVARRPGRPADEFRRATRS